MSTARTHSRPRPSTAAERCTVRWAPAGAVDPNGQASIPAGSHVVTSLLERPLTGGAEGQQVRSRTAACEDPCSRRGDVTELAEPIQRGCSRWLNEWNRYRCPPATEAAAAAAIGAVVGAVAMKPSQPGMPILQPRSTRERLLEDSVESDPADRERLVIRLEGQHGAFGGSTANASRTGPSRASVPLIPSIRAGSPRTVTAAVCRTCRSLDEALRLSRAVSCDARSEHPDRALEDFERQMTSRSVPLSTS